jgi:hypothetical protein
MILALAGKKKSGKDTIADFLVKDQKFTKLSLATPLKDLIQKVFKLDKDYLYNDKKKDEEFDYVVTIDYYHLDKIRDIISEEWGFPIDYETREAMEELYGKEIRTPRQLMQTIGTDLIRKNIRDDVFIVLLLEAIKKTEGHIVIADARLTNERETLSNIGAHLCLVKRDLPENEDNHISENDLGEEDEYDLVIENNIDINQLRAEINLWYTLTHKK